jgi:nicotinic acid phosphoribosyltransferase
VLFLLQQQGHLARRIENLGEQRVVLMERSDVSQICQIRQAYREVGYDLVKLLRFLDSNATGIRKILKKFDKRFGYKFTDYYVSTRANHPYSQLQQIFKQVVNYHATASFLFEKKDHSFPLIAVLEIQGVVAVVGALSRNLSYLQDHQGSLANIYDYPSLILKVLVSFSMMLTM